MEDVDTTALKRELQLIGEELNKLRDREDKLAIKIGNLELRQKSLAALLEELEGE